MIEFKHIITNGYVEKETLVANSKDGWKYAITLPANVIHPHAQKMDMISIFSKYTEELCVQSSKNIHNKNKGVYELLYEGRYLKHKSWKKDTFVKLIKNRKEEKEFNKL